MQGNLWRSPLNAEIYDRYVCEHGIYRFLSRHLVGLAGVADALRVLDLACGTGAATRACLDVLGADGEVIALDASAEMVAVARAQLPDTRVRFAVAPAADLARVCRRPVDRALCNASFWHFPSPRPVLRALARILDPVGGVFVFNVAAAMVRGATAPVHPFQVTLTRLVEQARGELHQPEPLEVDPVLLDQMLVEEGFEPAEQTAVCYRGTQAELMDLLEIPALLEPLAPDLSPATREALLHRARRASDPDEPVDVPWIYFRTRLQRMVV